MVFCDLGTDCHDCGNWTVEIPAYEADQDSLPIEFLHSRQVCPSSSLHAYWLSACKAELPFKSSVYQSSACTQGRCTRPTLLHLHQASRLV